MSRHMVMKNSSAKSVAEALGSARRSGEWWMARCPCHEDAHASLALRDGDDGKLHIKCHPGCDSRTVRRRLQTMGLLAPSGRHAQAWKPANESDGGTL